MWRPEYVTILYIIVTLFVQAHLHSYSCNNTATIMYTKGENHKSSLQEMTLVTKPGEGFGFAICGGVNGFPGNPLDETDEGIFISQVKQLLLDYHNVAS